MIIYQILTHKERAALGWVAGVAKGWGVQVVVVGRAQGEQAGKAGRD